MANRHLSRSIAMQSLFEWDFGGGKEDAKAVLNRNILEFGPGVEDADFAKKLVEGVFKHKKEIDDIIQKAAPEWPIPQIAPVDRNVLRIGLFELLYGNRKEVPPKVAINVAIELAKAFGGETSSKFINGVLGAVYKEMGEPGKEETSKHKYSIPDNEVPIERLGGAVIYAMENGVTYLALVHDVFGHWTLSKGHFADEKEEEKTGLERIIKDELGIDISIEEKIGDNSYIAFNPEKGKIKKQVLYFLARAPHTNLRLTTTGGLDDVKWFKLSDILDLNFYNDILPIVTKAVGLIGKKNP